jgi:hypothetical protein
MGEQNYVLKEMKDYGGGMLRLGATSFGKNMIRKERCRALAIWKGLEKPLCTHGVPARSLLVNTFGVKPTCSYATYVSRPNLGGLQWMQGTVPTPAGEIELGVSKRIK